MENFVLQRAIVLTRLLATLTAVILVYPSLACDITGCVCNDFDTICSNPMAMFSIPDTFPPTIGLLDISGASLHVLTKAELAPYGYLWNLSIVHSQLIAIESDAFTNSMDLSELRLHNNLITTDISRDLMEHFEFLTFADFSNNLIQRMHADILPLAFMMGPFLVMTGNPFHCNCELQWYMVVAEFLGLVGFPVELQCFTPPQFKGINLAFIPSDQYKCHGPKIECSQNATLQMCEPLQVECTAYGDPTPTLEITLPNGTVLEADTTFYDPSIGSISYQYNITEAIPEDNLGSLLLQADGYLGSTEDIVGWTVEGDCGPCGEECPTTPKPTTTEELTTDMETTSDVTTTTSSDVTVGGTQSTEEGGFGLGSVLAAGGVGLAVGIAVSLAGLGLMKLIEKAMKKKSESDNMVKPLTPKALV